VHGASAGRNYAVNLCVCSTYLEEKMCPDAKGWRATNNKSCLFIDPRAEFSAFSSTALLQDPESTALSGSKIQKALRFFKHCT